MTPDEIPRLIDEAVRRGASRAKLNALHKQALKECGDSPRALAHALTMDWLLAEYRATLAGSRSALIAPTGGSSNFFPRWLIEGRPSPYERFGP